MSKTIINTVRWGNSATSYVPVELSHLQFDCWKERIHWICWLAGHNIHFVSGSGVLSTCPLLVRSSAPIPLSTTSMMICSPEIVADCLQCRADTLSTFNCSLPGLESLQPGIHEGVTANYLVRSSPTLFDHSLCWKSVSHTFSHHRVL